MQLKLNFHQNLRTEVETDENLNVDSSSDDGPSEGGSVREACTSIASLHDQPAQQKLKV